MAEACGFCCGLCQLCCFTTYRCLCCVEETPHLPLFNVLCIGVTNSGKSTLLSVLNNETGDKVVATVGFSLKDIRLPNAVLKVKELGGGDNIRSYWQQYYSDAQGVIFVIDGSCTHNRLEDTRLEIHKALKHPDLRDLPWLILCNKQDLDGASTDQTVIEVLRLRTVMQDNSNILVKSCSKINVDGLRSNFETFADVLKQFYASL